MNHLWSKANDWWALPSGGDADNATTASTSSTPSIAFPSSSPSSPSWTYWDYANSSMSNAAEATYALFPSVPTLSSLTWPVFGTTAATQPSSTTSTPNNATMAVAKPPQPPSSLLGLWADRMNTSRGRRTSFQRLKDNSSNSNNSYNNNMSWMINNPYNSVRGGHGRHHYGGGYRSRQSMYAVRTFLSVAPVESIREEQQEDENDVDEKTLAAMCHDLKSDDSLMETSKTADGEQRNSRDSSTGAFPQQQQSSVSNNKSATTVSKQNSLTACHVAEGTIRALRDLFLDEAVELNAALRFWSDRWEHPLVSWLEAGPIGKSMYVVVVVVFTMREKDDVHVRDVECRRTCR
jgi:hypothetical protein